MKLAIRFATALCSFGVGLAAFAVFSWVRGPAMDSSIGPIDMDSGCRGTDYSNVLHSSNMPPVLEYCEIANRPECYSGKLLLMKARLTGDYHGMYFFGPSCKSKPMAGSLTWMSGDKYDVVWRKACRGHCREGLEVVVLGRFELVTPSHETNLNWHTMPMHFELLRFVEASEVRSSDYVRADVGEGE